MTDEEEKLEALRNAVVSAALPDAPGATMQTIYLNAVRDLTSWHLRILKWFKDPKGWCERRGIELPTEGSLMGLGSFLKMAMPELIGRREFYELIVSELFIRQFMPTQSLRISMEPTPSGLYANRVTSIGNEFLNFIEAPAA